MLAGLVAIVSRASAEDMYAIADSADLVVVGTMSELQIETSRFTSRVSVTGAIRVDEVLFGPKSLEHVKYTFVCGDCPPPDERVKRFLASRGVWFLKKARSPEKWTAAGMFTGDSGRRSLMLVDKYRRFLEERRLAEQSAARIQSTR